MTEWLGDALNEGERVVISVEGIGPTTVLREGEERIVSGVAGENGFFIDLDERLENWPVARIDDRDDHEELALLAPGEDSSDPYSNLGPEVAGKIVDWEVSPDT